MELWHAEVFFLMPKPLLDNAILQHRVGNGAFESATQPVCRSCSSNCRFCWVPFPSWFWSSEPMFMWSTGCTLVWKKKTQVSPKTKLLPIGRIGNPLHESSLGLGIPGYDLWGQEGPAEKGNKVHSFVFRISIFCCGARSIRHRRSWYKYIKKQTYSVFKQLKRSVWVANIPPWGKLWWPLLNALWSWSSWNKAIGRSMLSCLSHSPVPSRNSWLGSTKNV